MMNPPEKKRGTHRRLCFPADEEAGVAYRIAQGDMAGLPIDRVSARLLRLVADARENKPSFEPTPTCANIVEAWLEACLRAGRSKTGFNVSALPTLREVQEQFVRLFGEQNCPADFSIRRTLNRLELNLRRDRVGRPKNSHK